MAAGLFFDKGIRNKAKDIDFKEVERKIYSPVIIPDLWSLNGNITLSLSP